MRPTRRHSLLPLRVAAAVPLALIWTVAATLLLTAAELYPGSSPFGPVRQAAAQERPDERGGIEIGPDPAPPAPPPRRPAGSPTAPPSAAAVAVDSIRERIEEERDRLQRQEERLSQLEAQLQRDRVVHRRGAGDEDEDFDTGGDGALFRMGQDVEVHEGEIVREVVVMGGDLVVRGEVEGDAVAIGGDLTVVDGARVAGSAVTVGGRLDIERGAIVEGDRVAVGGLTAGLPRFSDWMGGDRWKSARMGTKLLRAFVLLLASLFLGWIAMLLFGNRLSRLADILQDNFGRSLLIGLLVLILWLPTVILTCITVIGIPVGIFILVAVPFGAFVGYLIGAIALGRRIAASFVFERSGALAHLLVGLTALAALGLLGGAVGLIQPLGPLSLALRILGWVLMSIVAMTGLGALAAAVLANLRLGRRSPPAGEPPAGEPPATGEFVTG